MDDVRPATGTAARAIGIMLMSAAVLGLLLSVLGFGLVWWAEGRINERVERAATQAREALDATEALLIAVDDSLAGAESELEAVRTALDSTARTTRDFGALAGGDAATVISDTRTALQSLSRTAGVIDTTLRVVSDLPLVGSARYRPDVPLAESIERVEQSLAPLPTQLVEAERNLNRTAASIESIRDELGDRPGRPGANTTLRAAQDSVAAYRATVDDLQRSTARVEKDFARALRWANLFASLLLVWLAVAQIGLLTQGYEWWRRGAHQARSNTNPSSE